MNTLGRSCGAALLLALPVLQLVSGAFQDESSPGLEQQVAAMSLDNASSRNDPNSASNYHQFITRHMNLDWTIDFEQNILSGSVLLTMERLTEAENVLILDASALDIHAVQDVASKDSLAFEYKPKGAELGGTLKIQLPSASVNAEHRILYTP